MWLLVVLFTLSGVALGVLIGARRPRRPEPERVEAATVEEHAADGLDAPVREAVDRLPIGVVVADSDGAVIYSNTTAASMSGTQAGLVLDDRVTALLARARDGEHVEELLELHGPPRMALMLISEPIEEAGAVATIQDFSEQARTDAMRTDFVANISHELKTPVGAIAVLADALGDETDPEVVRRIADRMTDESRRAVEAIDDLLELSWIESAPRGDDIVEMRAVIQAAVTRGRAAPRGRSVEVSCLHPPDDLLLRADERQLIAAIGNLVENAVKYSDDDGTVQIRTRVDDHAIEVMVVDHGIGIPQADIDRVFERFYRVDKGRSRSTGGSGLGLAIVRHVAGNHGGEVRVSSREGEGSTFVLRLPATLIVPAHEAATGPDEGRPPNDEHGQAAPRSAAVEEETGS